MSLALCGVSVLCIPDLHQERVVSRNDWCSNLLHCASRCLCHDCCIVGLSDFLHKQVIAEPVFSYFLCGLQGKIDNLSRYDPHDLFSGNPARMKQALQALLACPQNNLKLFLDGHPVHLSDDASNLDKIAAFVHQVLGSCLDPEFSSTPVEIIATLLQTILSTTGTAPWRIDYKPDQSYCADLAARFAVRHVQQGRLLVTLSALCASPKWNLSC